MRIKQLFVFAKDILSARVEREIDRASPKVFQVLGEVFVIIFTLLPTRRDRGDFSVETQLFHRVAEGRLVPLRAEEHDRWNLTRNHEARTLSVRPTKSSIERSVS